MKATVKWMLCLSVWTMATGCFSLKRNAVATLPAREAEVLLDDL